MNDLFKLLQKYAPLAARILFAQLFIVSGIGKIGHFAGTAAYMAGMGLTPGTNVLLVMTIVLEVGGGVALVAGWRVRWVAAAVGGFTFLASMIFHPFWNTDPAAMPSQLNNFMKNLAIIGGMLYVMAYGAGPFSLDSARGDAQAGRDRATAAKKRT